MKKQQGCDKPLVGLARACFLPIRLVALLALVAGGLIATPSAGLGQSPSQAWLSPGSVLRQGQSIASDSGQFVLRMQDDGNLVLYGPDGPMFATNTVGKGCQLEMQYDGNAVVYDRGHKPVWNSHTQGNEGAALIVQDDGNLVIYAADLTTPLWASGTNVNPPPTLPTARPGWMLSGDVLYANQSLASESGEFVLWMQDDGNLVLYGPEGPLFATGTNGRGVQVEMQYDGNVVVYDASHHPVWATGTQGNEGAVMVVQDDGNLVVYAVDFATPLWASRDAGAPQPSPGAPENPDGSGPSECTVEAVQPPGVRSR